MSNDSSLSQEQISMADLRSTQSTQACTKTSRYHNTKNQVADVATKILTKATVLNFSNIVLGNSAVDQSLNSFDTMSSIPFNDWGVVSEPYYHSS